MATVKKLEKKKEHVWTSVGPLALPEHYRIKDESLIPWLTKMTGLKVVPTEEKSPNGWFGIPAPDKDAGNKYLVWAVHEEHWSYVEIVCVDQQRSLSNMETNYIRSVMFDPNAVVVTYWPNDTVIQDYNKLYHGRYFAIARLAAPNDGVLPVPSKIRIR